MLLVNSVVSAYARTVRLPGADRLARQTETLALAPGRGLAGPRSRTVRASTESTAADTHRNDLRPDRPSIAGSEDSSDVSPNNIIESTWKTLLSEKQLEFEEHKE